MALTFFVAANHGVPLESAEIPVRAQSEVVLGPLQDAGLVDNPAGQRDPRADDRRLILGLHRELLFAHLPGRVHQAQAGYPQQEQQELVR